MRVSSLGLRLPKYTLYSLAFFIGINLLDLCLSQTTYTKICKNPQCSEEIFSSNFIRPHELPNDLMLSGKDKDKVSVQAISFSNRPDFVEGQSEDKTRHGLVYMTHLDMLPYIFALEEILKTNQALYQITMDKFSHKVLKSEQLKTNKELLMVYKVYAENHRIPLHEELKEKIDDMLHPRKSSSSGHVHTHDHGHGHSHDHGHSQEHSHDHGQKSEPSSSSEEQQILSPVKVEPNLNGEKANVNAAKAPLEHNVLPNAAESVTEQQQQLQNTVEQQQLAGNALPLSEPKKEGLNIDIKSENVVAHVKHEDPSVASPLPTGNSNSHQESGQAEQTSSQSHNPAAQHEKPPEFAPSLTTTEDKLPPLSRETLPLPGSTEAGAISEGAGSNALEDPVLWTIVPRPQKPSSQEVASSVGVGGENLERNQVDQQHQQPAPVINNNHLPNQQHKGGVSHEQEHKAELALGQKEQEHQQPPNIVAQDQPPAAVVAAQPSPNLSPVEDKVESPPPPAAPIPTPSTNDGSSGSGDPLNLDQNAPPLLQPTVAGNDEGERNRNSAAPAEGIIQTPLPPSSSHEIHHEGKKDADETVAHSHSTIHKPPASEEDIALSPPSEAAPPENANADIGATSSHEPPNNDDHQQQPATNNDFCYKEDCGTIDIGKSPPSKPVASSSNNYEEEKPSFKPNLQQMDAFRQFFRDAIDPVRALLPYPMCHFEYTGLFVVGFLVAAVLAHFVGWLCFSDNSTIRQQVADTVMLHRYLARIQEQELTIEGLKREASQSQQYREKADASARLMVERDEFQRRLQASEKRNSGLEVANSKFKTDLQTLESKHKSEASELAKAQALLAERGNELKNRTAELDKLRADVESLTVKHTEGIRLVASLEQDVGDRNVQIDRLGQDLTRTETELEKSRQELLAVHAELRDKNGIIDQLLEQVRASPSAASMSAKEVLAKSSGDATHDDSNNGHGSNGSAGGWSDLDIGGGDSPPSRKTSGSQQRPLPLTGSHDAVIESLSLRNQLKKLESDLQRLHSEKETALKQLEGEKRALADAHNALHKCELERNRYSDKCDKFEERLERESQKLERVHTDLSAARSVREKLDAELQQLKLEKSELNQLLKALQQEVKRLKDESQQHENRAFHNARRVKQLEQQLLTQKASSLTAARSLHQRHQMQMPMEMMSGGSGQSSVQGDTFALIPSAGELVAGVDGVGEPAAVPSPLATSNNETGPLFAGIDDDLLEDEDDDVQYQLHDDQMVVGGESALSPPQPPGFAPRRGPQRSSTSSSIRQLLATAQPYPPVAAADGGKHQQQQQRQQQHGGHQVFYQQQRGGHGAFEPVGQRGDHLRRSLRGTGEVFYPPPPPPPGAPLHASSPYGIDVDNGVQQQPPIAANKVSNIHHRHRSRSHGRQSMPRLLSADDRDDLFDYRGPYGDDSLDSMTGGRPFSVQAQQHGHGQHRLLQGTRSQASTPHHHQQLQQQQYYGQQQQGYTSSGGFLHQQQLQRGGGGSSEDSSLTGGGHGGGGVTSPEVAALLSGGLGPGGRRTASLIGCGAGAGGGGGGRQQRPTIRLCRPADPPVQQQQQLLQQQQQEKGGECDTGAGATTSIAPTSTTTTTGVGGGGRRSSAASGTGAPGGGTSSAAAAGGAARSAGGGGAARTAGVGGGRGGGGPKLAQGKKNC